MLMIIIWLFFFVAEIKIKQSDDNHIYNHTLARTLVEYASAVSLIPQNAGTQFLSCHLAHILCWNSNSLRLILLADELLYSCYSSIACKIIQKNEG